MQLACSLERMQIEYFVVVRIVLFLIVIEGTNSFGIYKIGSDYIYFFYNISKLKWL